MGSRTLKRSDMHCGQPFQCTRCLNYMLAEAQRREHRAVSDARRFRVLANIAELDPELGMFTITIPEAVSPDGRKLSFREHMDAFKAARAVSTRIRS